MYFRPHRTNIIVFLCFLGISVLLALTFADPAGAARKFKVKQCGDCHQDFIKQYQKKKSVHSMVKAGKCEECHLRHGRCLEKWL